MSEEHRASLPAADPAPDLGVYTVGKLLTQRWVASRDDSQERREFLVRWDGWSKSHDSWEPESGILDPTLIAALLRETSRTDHLDTAAVREAVLEHIRLEELNQPTVATQMHCSISHLSLWLRDLPKTSLHYMAAARTVEHAARVWLSKRMPARRGAASSGAPARKRQRGASTVGRRAGVGSERWAMCDLCSKWRRLPVAGKLPAHWSRSTVESSLTAFLIGLPQTTPYRGLRATIRARV